VVLAILLVFSEESYYLLVEMDSLLPVDERYREKIIFKKE